MVEQRGDKQHHKVKDQHHRIGHCRIAAGRAFHAFLVLCQCIGFFIHLYQPFPALPVLQGFGQATQAVQHKAGKLPGSPAELHSVAPAELGDSQRNNNPHDEIRRQRNEPQQPVEITDEQAHHNGEQEGNG